MFNILLSMKKAAIYIVVLVLAFFPAVFIETPVKTYAAGVAEEEVQATEPAEAAEAVTEPAPEAEAPEEDLPDIDFLDIPEIQDAKIDAQATLMAKREDLDRAWLELKEKEQEEARERMREAAEAAKAAAAGEKEDSGESHSSGSAETAEHGSGRDLGQFKLTAYCPCYQCSEGWGRMTSSGRLAQERHTIATDPSVIPEGTRVEINGVVYTAEDIGGGVRGNHIDIFYESHEECLQFGVRYAEVYKVN